MAIGGEADEVIRVAACVDCPEADPAALVLVSVKRGDTRTAADAIAPRLGDDTVIATIQNGLDPERELSEALGKPVARVIGNLGVTFEEPGRVSYWGGGVMLGPGLVEDRMAALFARAGLKVDRTDDLERISWEKMAANCVANPLTALTGRRNREVITPSLAGLRRQIVAEVAAVATAEGVALADDLADKLDAALLRSGNVNSMLQDLRRGRETEIEWINGEVARRAARHGLAAPVNSALAELVRLRSRRDP